MAEAKTKEGIKFTEEELNQSMNANELEMLKSQKINLQSHVSRADALPLMN